MKKIDELITKFKEFKDELLKNVNMSYSSEPNVAKDSLEKDMVPPPPSTGTINSAIGFPFGKGEKMTMCKNGQWSLDKVDPQENVNIPHPKKAPKMAQDPKIACPKCKASPCKCAN